MSNTHLSRVIEFFKDHCKIVESTDQSGKIYHFFRGGAPSLEEIAYFVSCDEIRKAKELLKNNGYTIVKASNAN